MRITSGYLLRYVLVNERHAQWRLIFRSACSIACHTDHEQIELFPKRNFRCDCPTSALPHACTLHKAPEDANEGNIYGQNFKGLFCRCSRHYDPKTERETMIQCAACEVSFQSRFVKIVKSMSNAQDWFHESCLNLRERPSSREPSPVATASPKKSTSEGTDEIDENDDGASEASSSGLPPPLIQGSEYESFICGSCVSEIPILKRYAGTPGVMMVVRDDPTAPWKPIGMESPPQNENHVEVGDEVGPASAGVKRSRPISPTIDLNSPDAKRVRAFPTPGSAPCLAPLRNQTAQKLYTSCAANDFSLGAGDIFLTDGWRGRWCHCNSVSPTHSSLLLHSCVSVRGVSRAAILPHRGRGNIRAS